MKTQIRPFPYSAALLQWLLVLAFALCSAPAALADGGITKVYYPDQEDTAFTVDVPSEWKLMAQGEVGAEEYFEVEGPNGLELSFRTVPGADINAAVEAHVAYLKENFSDIQVGNAVETKINGMDAIILPATGTNEDGSVRDLGAGFFQVSDSAVGELWYNVEKTDAANGAAAVKVLNSLQKGG